MSRKLIISSAIAAGAAVTSYLLIDENRRQDVKNKINDFTNYLTGERFPIEEAGKPELDDLENSEMVAEGSQFGVQYYNEVKSE
ncbi:hypothetical protein ACKXGF_06285 [Alkalibacillus sp. S2W]|uniref:hypothetical protein n=1 Tax=Alkalibacillus TaxID=331654 RepID=UPI00141DD4B6|nr:hypothetical protein [Alkalibacillus almallahensis]NIK10650.1 hypothetical protein [Alkalibacillus almallahensis]